MIILLIHFLDPGLIYENAVHNSNSVMAADDAVVVNNPVYVCHRVSDDNTCAICNFYAVSVNSGYITNINLAHGR